MPGPVLGTWSTSENKTKVSFCMELRSFCYSMVSVKDEDKLAAGRKLDLFTGTACLKSGLDIL